MKLILPFILTALVASNFVPATAFEAGVGFRDITPQQWPLKLLGSFTPKDSETVHDPISARAIAFRNGEGRAVIVLVDNVGVRREVLDSIKAKAAQSSGWKTEEMLIAATHSHSCPSLSGTEGPAGAYREFAEARIAEAIGDAIASLRKAQVGFASGSVPDEVFNRRWFLKEGTMLPNPFGEIDQVKMNPPHNLITSPAGPVDPEVGVIDVRTDRGKPLALLANYALHYVGGIPGNQVSADYFGEFARIMAYRASGRVPEFLAVLSNGTSGDINNIDFLGKRAPRAPFEQVRLVAAKVADASWQAIREIQHHPNPKVATRQREVTLKYRNPTAEAVDRARKILEMDAEERKQLPALADHYAARTLAATERAESCEVIIQAIRIGDQAIVSLPFEVLVEIGIEIKEKSPFPHTMIIGLANGSGGYLPTPRQHELGGYETWRGTCHVQEDASVILTKNLLEMLGELKN